MLRVNRPKARLRQRTSSYEGRIFHRGILQVFLVCSDSNHPLLSEGLIFKASVSPSLGRSRLRMMRSLSSMVEAAFALRFFDSGGRAN